MDNESQWVRDRIQLYRLRGKHPSWSSEQLAAAVGRSERWVRKWVQRLQAVAIVTFETFQSQSRAPKRRPRQIGELVRDAVCELREQLTEQYHRPAGASLIRGYLKQHPVLQRLNVRLPTSSRTITQILRQRGYLPTRAKRERMPLEVGEPMEEWEIDFCEIRLLGGRFEFLLVVDRATSRLIDIEGCEGYRADTALSAIFRLLTRHGLPKRLRFDRDPRWVGSWSSDGYPSPLVRLLLVLGIEPVICPPRRPDKKPYVERCVRTFKYEWLDRFSLDTLATCYEAVETFAHYYNHQRRHFGRACQGQTPDEAFPNLPRLPRLPDQVQPNAWLLPQHGRVYRRRIRANGSIQVDKHEYYVDEKLAHQSVLVHLDAHHHGLWVSLDGKPVKMLPLKGLYDGPLALAEYWPLLKQEAISIAYYRDLVWRQSADAA